MIMTLKNTFLALAALAPACAGVAQQRPNILYILTDQQTATAMSCMGNTDVHTPNMDRLAAAGILFRNAYCSAPLSGPSRASMFTGYTSHEIGLAKNNIPMPDSVRTQTLGTLMQQAGYECAYAGKWHVHTASMPDGEFGFHTLHPHNDNGLAEACVDFLNRSHRKPFFLVASFDNPHNICEYARSQNLPFAELAELPQDEWPGLPPNFAKNPYDADVLDYEQSLNYSAYPTRNFTPDQWRRYRSAYFRLVEKVDAEIGKIVDALDRRNLWKNTVVIFASDHGDGMGAHRWNQKSALYEEVVNVPFIVSLPGKKNAGRELPQLVNAGVDFFASVCEWAGIDLPAHRYGVSFKTLAEQGNAEAVHQPFVVTETMFDKGKQTRGWMVRTPRYKYVLYDKGAYREQFFDMENDRGEMRNLAIEKKYQQQILEHRQLLQEWMKLHHVAQIRPEVHLIPGIIPQQNKSQK